MPGSTKVSMETLRYFSCIPPHTGNGSILFQEDRFLIGSILFLKISRCVKAA